MESFGRVDILVNNAGITRDTLLLRMSVDQWDSVIDANLKGAFLCSRAASKIMLRQKSGRIVNIASVNGLRGSAGQTNYSASKAGLIGFSRSLAKELASRGITVNVVAPGFIDTQMTDAFEGDARERLLKTIPLGRFGQSEDVGAAVAFLASNAASYITGQVLTVDGGVTV
jgi:3-oxoacyl-[acyl-carrier protein] reductase